MVDIFVPSLIAPLEYTNAKALPYCVGGAEQTRAIEKKIIAA